MDPDDIVRVHYGKKEMAFQVDMTWVGSRDKPPQRLRHEIQIVGSKSNSIIVMSPTGMFPISIICMHTFFRL